MPLPLPPPKAWRLRCICWALPPPPPPRRAASRPRAAVGRCRRPLRPKEARRRRSSSSSDSTPALSPERPPGEGAGAGAGCIIRVGARLLPRRPNSRRCCGRRVRKATQARRWRWAITAGAVAAEVRETTSGRQLHKQRATPTSGMNPKGAAAATTLSNAGTKARETRPPPALRWWAPAPLGSWPRARWAKLRGGWSASTTGSRRW